MNSLLFADAGLAAVAFGIPAVFGLFLLAAIVVYAFSGGYPSGDAE